MSKNVPQLALLLLFLSPPAFSQIDPALTTISNAKTAFEHGQRDFYSGQYAAARHEFDRAIEIILTAPTSIRQDDGLRAYYRVVIELIDGYNKKSDGKVFGEQNYEPSPLDSLTSLAQWYQPVLAEENQEQVAGNSFNLSAERLPVGYKGDNIQQVFFTLKRTVPSKGEFESSAAFQKRLKVVDTRRLYAFTQDIEGREGNCSLTYDADAQKWDVFCQNLYSIWVIKRDKPNGSYRGSNAFGVTRTIQKISRVIFDLSNSSKLGESDWGFVNFQIPMPADRARLLKNRMTFLYLCKLSPADDSNGFVKSETDYGSPTIDRPRELEVVSYTTNVKLVAIWIYDKQTGEVLAKH